MTGRAVWRRTTGPVTGEGEGDVVLRCGGREMSVEERYELMRERRLARKREQEKLEDRKPEPDDEEDELKAAERFRNDRYAVKLLKQDGDAWGGSSGDTGVLG
ncbi:MAG: hypothetical protein SYR96_11890 [Actinomycetota bacterium]|nr:hypothetical protein [Actinomycetota bacterium]